MMVSSSCSTSGRGRITIVMVSSSCSTCDRGRVTLVMVSSSCSTSNKGRVIHVMVSGTAYLHKSNTISVTRQQELLSIARLTRPLSLVEEELLPSQE
jgi:hypothetical protein